MRKRHDNKRDKDRLESLHYCAGNIITKSLLSEEHPTVVPEEARKLINHKMGSFYTNYSITLPINPVHELSTERI